MSCASSNVRRGRPISVRLSTMQPRMVAAQRVAALAADGDDLHGLARAVELADAAPRLAQDRGVEAAGKAAIRGRDHQQMRLRPCRCRRAAAARWPCPEIGGERAEHALHALRIGARSLGLFLRAAQARGGDHLHRRRDLLRRAHAADAHPQFLEGRHRAVLVLTRRSWRNRRGSPASPFSVSAAISRLSRIAARILRRLARCSSLEHRRLVAVDRWRSRPCRDSRACRQRSTTTCSSTGTGANCGCFNSSVRRAPRASRRWVAASRSEANCANAAISRYCASSSLMRPATCFIALICAAEPTRLTDEADIDRRADAAIEQLGFEEDLAVGDRDHVGRDIGRHVAGLRLDDRQRGQRAEPWSSFILAARSSSREWR